MQIDQLTEFSDYSKYGDLNGDGIIDYLDEAAYESLDWLTDLNGDNEVNQEDLEIYEALDIIGDLNGDGFIDLEDW